LYDKHLHATENPNTLQGEQIPSEALIQVGSVSLSNIVWSKMTGDNYRKWKC